MKLVDHAPDVTFWLQFLRNTHSLEMSESFFYSRWEVVTFNLHKHMPTHTHMHISLLFSNVKGKAEKLPSDTVFCPETMEKYSICDITQISLQECCQMSSLGLMLFTSVSFCFNNMVSINIYLYLFSMFLFFFKLPIVQWCYQRAMLNAKAMLVSLKLIWTFLKSHHDQLGK